MLSDKIKTNDMKERIAAAISFIGVIAGILGVIYVIYFEHSYAEVEEWLLAFLVMGILISTILYIIWTKFGKKGLTELEQIDYENQLLRKKIEQQELLKKLEK